MHDDRQANQPENVSIMWTWFVGQFVFMTGNSVTGAQVIARASQLLKLVAERGTAGRTMAELVGESGLKRPTVHRLLLALQMAGFIEQENGSRLWHLGPEISILGTLAGPRYRPIELLARNSLIRLATETGDSAFLSVRRAGEVICMMREEGAFPIRTHVLQAGDRLPLGVGSAGLAMLAQLANEQVEALIAANRDSTVRGRPVALPETIRELVAQTRQAGYAVNKGMLLPGSWGIAVVVPETDGLPTAALSITAIEQRLQPDRQAELGLLLKEEADRLGRRLRLDRSLLNKQRIGS